MVTKLGGFKTVKLENPSFNCNNSCHKSNDNNSSNSNGS